MYKFWAKDVAADVPLYGHGPAGLQTGFMTETDFVEEGGMVMTGEEIGQFVAAYLATELYGASEIRIVKVDKIEAPAYPSHQLATKLGLVRDVEDGRVVWRAK